MRKSSVVFVACDLGTAEDIGQNADLLRRTAVRNIGSFVETCMPVSSIAEQKVVSMHLKYLRQVDQYREA